jgi:hypothetical protein
MVSEKQIYKQKLKPSEKGCRKGINCNSFLSKTCSDHGENHKKYYKKLLEKSSNLKHL